MISLRYKDRKTALHRLNPFPKLLWVAAIFILALIFDHPAYTLLLLLSTLPVVAAAGMGREWFSVMRYALYLGLAIVVVNAAVSYHGATVLWQGGFSLPVIGTPVVTLEAVAFGVGMALRLLAIISALAVLNFTTHPDDIMLATIKLRLPYRSALVTALSARFMPTLVEDAQRISDVQRSRGLEIDRGSPVARIKRRTAVLIPLLANSLDRAVQVAEAMEARAFGAGRRRSFYHRITLTRFDILLLALGGLPIILGVVLKCLGQGVYRYYPSLGEIGFDAFAGAMLGLLLLLMNTMAPLALLYKRLELD